jgi:serine/threonine protein kinase
MIEAGTVLQNRYLIQKQIGQGGMGTVYIATDQRFNSLVAIKETIFTDASLLRAFEREAQLLNSLRHPALPRVSDFFTEGDGHFLVMEFIEGEDLSVILENQGAFAAADVSVWADQLLDALDYLHSQKTPVVHRDIKPQNLKLLAQRGQIILLDFGLAKGTTSDVSKLSQTKSVFGYSRAYAPLEQIQGTGTDPRSDIYSLAATVYHLFTGKAPVDALTRATAVLNNQPDPLRLANKLNPSVHPGVAQVLQTALSLNANLRPQSASAMRDALTRAGELPIESFTDDETENAAIVADLFTPNTQLIHRENGESGKETSIEQPANATAAAAANIAAAEFEAAEAALQNAPDADAATRVSSGSVRHTEQPKADTDPQPVKQATSVHHTPSGALHVPIVPEQPVHARGVIRPKRRSMLTPVGVAAAIAILGGGGFATWYATNNNGSGGSDSNLTNAANEANVQTQTLKKPVANESKQSEQNADASPTAGEAQMSGNKNPAETQSSAQPSRQQPEARVVIVEGEKPQNQSDRKSENETGEENAGEESQQQQDEPPPTEENGDEMDEPPPPPRVRAEDIRKLPPEERAKAVEQLTRQKIREVQRRIRETNRRRQEKGLPPLVVPKMPETPPENEP